MISRVIISRGFPVNNPAYFLWHFAQLLASLDLKAFSPLWQTPQYLPAFMSAIVICAPFFIGKIFVWQSVHFKPASACVLPANMTLPADAPAYSTVFPEAIAKALLADATAKSIAKPMIVKRTSSPPFVA